MANLSYSERRSRGLEVLRQRLGGADPDQAAAVLEEKFGPLGSYIVDVLLGALWSRGHLSAADRSLVTLSVLTTQGVDDHFPKEVEAALANGLDESMIEETILTLCGYAGFPRAITALTAAQEVFMTDASSDPRPVRQRSKRQSDRERSDASREIAAIMYPEMVAAREVGVDLGDFTTEVLRFAYGEIWPREEMSLRERSLVVTASLVTQGSAEMQAHMRAAPHNGITAPELEELLVTTALYAGFPTCVEGFKQYRIVQAG
jgi:4-carboxymuconolactone decarboxylase